MNSVDWKQRLYDAYVSTGQSAMAAPRAMRLADYSFFTHVIRRFVPSGRDVRIADLGCGHGAMMFCLRELGYRNVQGVDVSSEQVSLARTMGVEKVACLDIEAYLQAHPNAFDVIFLMDVLEHVSKPSLLEFLDRVHGSLRHGGRAILHIPNAEGLFGMGVRYGDLTHELCFTRQSISQALRACQFGDIGCYEDRPVIHGLRSFVRRILWGCLTIPARLVLLAETGTASHILSRNMLVVASK